VGKSEEIRRQFLLRVHKKKRGKSIGDGKNEDARRKAKAQFTGKTARGEGTEKENKERG